MVECSEITFNVILNATNNGILATDIISLFRRFLSSEYRPPLKYEQIAKWQNNKIAEMERKKQSIPQMGLEPTIPGLGGRCLIH